MYVLLNMKKLKACLTVKRILQTAKSTTLSNKATTKRLSVLNKTETFLILGKYCKCYFNSLQFD